MEAKKIPTRVYMESGKIIEMENKKFTLKEMQEIVKGYIDVVHLTPDLVMVVNDEGKLHGLPINDSATSLYQYYRNTNDIIVGNVIVMDAKNLK